MDTYERMVKKHMQENLVRMELVYSQFEGLQSDMKFLPAIQEKLPEKELCAACELVARARDAVKKTLMRLEAEDE